VTRQSIRMRLTAWYLAILAVALAALAGGSWWLLRRSVVDAANSSLEARIIGVRLFLDGMARESTPAEMVDEFREYSQLTLGETLLEVRDGAGTELVRPTMPGWEALRIADAPAAGPPVMSADRTSQGRPFRVAAARIVVQGRPYHVIAAIPMGAADNALDRFGWLLGVLLPTVLLFAAVGGYWLSRRALAPVDRMTRAAQAITVRNLDRRLDVPAADDELRQLAMTFNDMLARLQAAVAEMVRLTAEASHELRTPVSLVRATAEVALARDRPAGDYREALAEVLEHAERMSSLVDDLLTLARSDAGVEPRETTTVDLRQVAADAARAVQSTSLRKPLTVDLDLPDTPVDVEGQAESLRRLVLILLDNAVKYTPPGGHVRLSVAVRRGEDAGREEVAIDVVDTGIGIDAADLPHVFNRFYRGAAARHAAADGSGLGLSIARTIVERGGGTIALEAGPGGRGCRAVVRLPRARPPEL
jgi:heavy metal sensor kinase